MAQFPEIYTEQAKIFKAIGHPARLMMVEALLEGPKTVSELTAIVQLEMPTVSRHLNCLKEEKKGNSIIYSVELTCLKNFLHCSRSVVVMKKSKTLL